MTAIFPMGGITVIVNYERDIKETLRIAEECIRKGTSNPDSCTGPEDIVAFITDVSKQLSRHLHNAARVHTRWNRSKREINDSPLCFSVFPGYVDNNNKRVSITGEYTDEADAYIALDVHNGEDTTYCPSVFSLAYHYLFIGKSEAQNDVELYADQLNANQAGTNNRYNIKYDLDWCVGGTHQWVSKVADSIALNESLDPLEMLAMYKDIYYARNDQKNNATWLTIPVSIDDEFKYGPSTDPIWMSSIDDNDPLKSSVSRNSVHYMQAIETWCRHVVRKLFYPSSTGFKEDLEERWPFNPGPPADDITTFTKDYPNYGSHPISTMASIENNHSALEDLLVYRAYIVAFWIQSIFNPTILLDDRPEGKDISDAWYHFDKYFYNMFTYRNDMFSKDKITSLLGYRVNRIAKLKLELAKHFVFSNKESKDYKAPKSETDSARRGEHLYYKPCINMPAPNKPVPEYGFWYTIPFKHRISLVNEVGRSSHLPSSQSGSLMIVSNTMLDKEYFRFIVPWVEKLFEGIREFETAAASRISLIEAGGNTKTISVLNNQIRELRKIHEQHMSYVDAFKTDYDINLGDLNALQIRTNTFFKQVLGTAETDNPHRPSTE